MGPMGPINPIESMRKRPGMYIGRMDSLGLHNMFRELIDNAMDACSLETGGTILVDLQADGGIRVRCNALIHPFSWASDLPQSLQEAFLAIYNLGPDQRSASLWALNWNDWGWDLCLINALSRSMLVEIQQGDQRWRQEFHNQQPVNRTSELVGTTETATILTFYPDEAIFEDVAAPWELIAQYLSQSSYLLPGLTFSLSDHRYSPTRVSHFPQTNGVEQYVVDLTRDQHPLGSPIVIKDEIEETTVHIAFQYSEGCGQILSFVNNQRTVEDGSHVAGFLDALQRTLRKVSRLSGASTSEAFPLKRVTPHMTAVVSIWTSTPAFAGATRNELNSPEVRRAVYDATKKGLQSSFDTHPDGARQLLAYLPIIEEKV